MVFTVNGDRLKLLYEHGARWQRGYEPHIHQALMQHVREGTVFFDVGAHVGFHTLAATVRGAHVIAFEAAPDTAAILREHVRLNNAHVQVIEAAVGDREGTISFFVNDGTMSASITRKAVDELAPQKFEHPAREVTVPTVTLDRYGPADLVKIDVEGAEHRVLQGATGILDSDARILLEIHPLQLEAAGSSENAVLELLAAHGRRPVAVDERNSEGIYHAWLEKF